MDGIKMSNIDELKEALKKDWNRLYVKEFTTKWETERLIRETEIDVMSLESIESLISQAEKEARIDEAMLANRMAHASSGDLLFENIHNRLTQLRKE